MMDPPKKKASPAPPSCPADRSRGAACRAGSIPMESGDQWSGGRTNRHRKTWVKKTIDIIYVYMYMYIYIYIYRSYSISIQWSG